MLFYENVNWILFNNNLNIWKGIICCYNSTNSNYNVKMDHHILNWNNQFRFLGGGISYGYIFFQTTRKINLFSMIQ